MKMRAPEGTTSAAVESDQYEVDEHGHIEVVNGEHIPQLERHGFTQIADEDGDTVSEPVDEVGSCPDFSKFVNREALIFWLVAHGDDSHKVDEKRGDLEAACVACFEAGAERVQPEATEEVVEEPEQGEATEEVVEEPEQGETENE